MYSQGYFITCFSAPKFSFAIFKTLATCCGVSRVSRDSENPRDFSQRRGVVIAFKSFNFKNLLFTWLQCNIASGMDTFSICVEGRQTLRVGGRVGERGLSLKREIRGFVLVLTLPAHL